MSYRRGACPALSAPMLTGDGLLVRLATAGASLTPHQLIALCASAERHGNGLVEITARGNFQIRGLTDESAATLADDIAAMELGLRDGVPVETNPLAGLDPSEIADAALLAGAIRNAIDATDLKDRLAPKVSVVVDGGGANDLSALSADVRLTAVRQDGKVEWLISTGGDASTATSLAIADNEPTAVGFTLAILEAIAGHGHDARARDLAPAEMNQGLRPAAAPDLPPYTGEGDHAKRGEGGGIALTNGRFALPVSLPFGSVRADELVAFLDNAQAHGVTELRLAPSRNLILICESKAGASDILKAARATGLIVDADDPRARIFACPGSAGCASGHIPAREIAAQVVRELDGSLGAGLDLHISGCPKGCAHPAPAVLALVGTESGPVLVENDTARQTGIPFGNQDIAERFASAVRQLAARHETRDEHSQKRPERALAGE
jgi:precorrin-3B synthase